MAEAAALGALACLTPSAGDLPAQPAHLGCPANTRQASGVGGPRWRQTGRSPSARGRLDRHQSTQRASHDPSRPAGPCGVGPGHCRFSAGLRTASGWRTSSPSRPVRLPVLGDRRWCLRRRMLGWSIASSLRSELILAALEMALSQRRPLPRSRSAALGGQGTRLLRRAPLPAQMRTHRPHDHARPRPREERTFRYIEG